MIKSRTALAACLASAFITAFGGSAQATEASGAGPRARAAATLPARQALMPLGASITYGYDGVSTQGGYRAGLWSDLHDDGLDVDFVGSLSDGPTTMPDRDHEGHSGWRIDQIAAAVNPWLNTYKPDFITLLLGTNDMVQNYDVANAPARMHSLIDQIIGQLPNCTVMLASLPPAGDPTINARVQAYNAALPAIAVSERAAGRQVYFVSMANLTTADLISDGIHPNPTGYAKLAEIWHHTTLPLMRGARAPLLTVGAKQSFQVTTPGFTDRFMDINGVTSVVTSSSDGAAKKAATFRIVSGLASGNCYSLQSVSTSNVYLRHRSDTHVHGDPTDNTDQFKGDATWCTRPGATGHGVTFESYNAPGTYIRHFNAQLWIGTGADLNGPDGYGPFLDDATWDVVHPLTRH